MGSPDDEDEAWREIVANYGDAPSAEELDAPPPREDDEGVLRGLRPGSAEDPDAGHTVWEEERWTPPDPGPIPVPTPPRLAAWLGVFGAPTILLVCVVAGVSLSSLLSTLLIAWFLGGFGYLVATMRPGPRDPGDDGARV